METLPIEIIEKILAYHKSKDLEVYKCVNRTFYEIVSRRLSYKQSLKICIPMLLNESTFKSMIFTRRRFDELELDITGIEDLAVTNLLNLLGNRGSEFSFLRIQQSANATPIKLSIFIKIFDNLKDLYRIVTISKIHTELDIPLHNLLSRGLHKLAIGAIKIAAELDHLPELVLRSIGHFRSSGRYVLTWSISFVTFDEIFEVNADSVLKNKIENLLYDSGEEEHTIEEENFVADLLNIQNSIQELNLNVSYPSNFKCGSNLLRTIGTKTSLTTLYLKLDDDLAIDEIRALGNLANLENLSISMRNDDEITINFMELSFPCLKDLSISCSWPNLDEKILRKMMSTNWPKLQELDGHFDGDEDINLRVFLDGIPALESFSVNDLTVQSLRYQKVHYPTLHKLLLMSSWDEDSLIEQMTPDFIKALPNLIEMKISALTFIVSRATMQAILDSQIKELEMSIIVQPNDENEIEELIERIKAEIKIVTQ